LKKDERKAECLNRLRELLKPGDTVYTILESVSRSGMCRWIRPIVIIDNRPVWIGSYVSDVLGVLVNNTGSVRVRGAGMDAGSHLVGNLSWALFANDNALRHEWI